jgi:putative ABC transport system ATP-binding protein
MNIIEAHDLQKVYSMGDVHVRALDNISFSIEAGEMVCVMGKSGSGKSTLLRQMGLLDRPTGGMLKIDNKSVIKMGEGERADLRLNFLGYVFQEYALLGELTALENVFLPGMMLGKKGLDFKNRASELLALVGLATREKHLPKELSGGEQQRVAIARALINDPKIVFADEPCANLDTISSKTVMETLVRLNTDMKVTVIFVSHDPEDKSYARRVILLSDGQIIPGDKIGG